MFKFLEALTGFYFLIKKFLVHLKEQEILQAKDKAIETGDSRDLEKSLSENNPVDIAVDKYPGMYERPVKKKS